MMRRRLYSLLAAGTAAAALMIATQPILAQETAPQDGTEVQPAEVQPPEQAVVTADELVHDRALGTVTARGGVEVQYGGRILLADTVNYQIASDRVTATGSVVLTQQDGNVLFADHIELTGQLAEGYAREVRLLLADGSRAAARTATRTGGRVTELNQAVYSACDSCPTDPSKPLIWQVKAMRVVHDQEEKEIVYRDAWLEMWGVPVAYTPYLSHPDPTVERQSGLLAPSYGSRRELGVTLTVPYYHVIAPNHDVTFAPMMTSKEGLMLGGEYRYIGERLSLKGEGSIIRDSKKSVRNHLDAEAVYLIDDTWRAGADINLTSDDTYMRIYDRGEDDPAFLTSRAYLEGFGQRSYASAESFYFQSLTQPGVLGTTSLSESPIVAPLVEWHMATAPTDKGHFQTATVSAVSLLRQDGSDSRRLSGEWGWHLPHIAQTGEVYRLDASLRGDVYNVDSVTRPGTATTVSTTTGRVIPQVALTWSLPLERDHETFNEVIEPIVMGVISPRGQNPTDIPNEDSLDFEFDDTNLFSANRFTGWDRVEGGPRVNYGVKWGAYGPSFGRLEALFGQTYHASSQGLFTEDSGLQDNFSDFVGRVLVRPNANLSVLYRFRLDKETLELRRNELSAVAGPPILRGSISYTGVAGRTLWEGGAEQREDLALGISSEISRYWRASARMHHDLSSGGGLRYVGAMVEYEDECFIFTLDGAREYTYDRDYEGGYAVALRFTLKTLGDIRTSQ